MNKARLDSDKNSFESKDKISAGSIT